MSTLEIKGKLHELIVKLNSKDHLLQVTNLLKDLVKQEEEEEDWWDELPKEVQENIDKAIVEVEDKNNLVSHEEVMKKYRKWQKK